MYFKNIENLIENALRPVITDTPEGKGWRENIHVELTRDPAHGDVTTNAAMILAKPSGRKPRELAAMIEVGLKADENITDVEIAGPGFVNLRLKPAFWHARLGDILAAGELYGQSKIGQGQSVNVEYVSANPTGPMHIGHARGAVVGDVIANLLAYTGYQVTREYYVNDAGSQIDTLARSVYLRYRQALGEEIGAIPEGLYPGAYLIPVGEDLAQKYGDQWKNVGEDQWMTPMRQMVVTAMMDMIRDDLALLGVRHDVFFSEYQMTTEGKVGAVFNQLEQQRLIYVGVLNPPKGKKPDDWESRPQALFKTGNFGDDCDRPLKKSDGAWTYFAADIAYHHDKIARGHDLLVNIWGADHKGYVKRLQAAVDALSHGQTKLDIILTDLVHLSQGGQPVKMSKRAGSYVTVRDAIERVGKDVVRFIMLTRKNDQVIEFDLEKAVAQSRDNPVFYVQYAHARCHSLFRLAKETFPNADFSRAALLKADFSILTDDDELALMKKLADWPRVVEQATQAYEPHRCASYLYDIAAAFHALWTKGREEPGLRFLLPDDERVTRARLALVRGLCDVIASGLRIFDVKPVKEM